MRLAATALGATVLLGAFGCDSGKKESEPEALTRYVIENISPKATDEDLDHSVELLHERLEKLHVSNSSVSKEGERIVVIVPTGSVDMSLVLRTGRLELFDLQGDLVEDVSLDAGGWPRPSRKPLRARRNTVVVTCRPPARYCPGLSEEPARIYYYLFKYDPDDKAHPVPELTGNDLELKGTRQDFEPATGEPVVLFQFTKAGAKKFEEVTLRLAERGRVVYNQNGGDPTVAFQQFAIVLDRDLKSAPTIDFQQNPGGIPGDNGAEITGIGSVSEAKDLALVLQVGALPVDFKVISKEEAHK